MLHLALHHFQSWIIIIRLEYEIFFLLIFTVSLTANYKDYLYLNSVSGYSPTFNSFGQIGLIQTPSALSKPEGSVSFIFNRNEIWKYGTLSVSPFNWLEASYFYYRPSDLLFGNTRGLYLDKGFNVKFTYRPKNSYIPNLAIGLDDFSGTGLFTKEYIVMSKSFNNSIVSFGLGWGKFSGENSFNNPLSFISDRLNVRPALSDNYSQGGSPSYDLWFRGDTSVFGGIEYLIPGSKGLKLKVELDPFDYKDVSANYSLGFIDKIREKDSDINLGLSFPWNDYLTFDICEILP